MSPTCFFSTQLPRCCSNFCGDWEISWPPKARSHRWNWRLHHGLKWNIWKNLGKYVDDVCIYIYIISIYCSKELKNETAWEIQFCSFYYVKGDCCMNIIGFFYHLCIIISKTTKKGVISSKTYASRIFHDQGTNQLIDQGNFPWRMHLKFAGKKCRWRMQLQ